MVETSPRDGAHADIQISDDLISEFRASHGLPSSSVPCEFVDYADLISRCWQITVVASSAKFAATMPPIHYYGWILFKTGRTQVGRTPSEPMYGLEDREDSTFAPRLQGDRRITWGVDRGKYMSTSVAALSIPNGEPKVRLR